MEDNPLTYKEQEQNVFYYHTEQHQIMSNSFFKRMNKNSYKEHIKMGLFAGTIAGLMFGFMYGKTKANTPVRDKDGHVIEYKYDGKIMSKAMLEILAAALLIALVISGGKASAERPHNRDLSEELAVKTLQKYFESPLKNYAKEPKVEFWAVQAAAFIMYNMPESDMAILQSLAVSELTRDANGNYIVPNESIKYASQIISNFMNCTPGITPNVLRIMRGENPQTYILKSAQQKTK